MTQENSLLPLQEWWNNLEFAYKSQYELAENGSLSRLQINDYKQHKVADIAPDNADVMFKLLVEKFADVEAKVSELAKEWDEEAGDKLKHLGKLERTKEYILHANAAGDFSSIFKVLENITAEADKLVSANYDKKLAVVEKVEGEANSEEWRQATDNIKQLVDEWKELGFVDKKRNDELWTRIETAKDKFFERKREHTEEVNKEMLQNLDLKMEIVDKAEALAASENWRKATDELKALMEQWKSVGRTMHDKNEELWQRFSAANNVFFERKKVHFEKIHAEQDENLKLKLTLVEQAEALKDNTDWNATTDAYKQLMDEWKKIGRVSKEKSDEVWNSFNAARDHFFGKKRESAAAFKLDLEDNYAQKLALLKRAETLQSSTAWKSATDELNELMDEWKKIGPVPRKHSDEIWNKFITARKTFFERKDADREKRKAYFEQKEKERVSQTGNFVDKVAAELKEEEDKLADFQDALKNITPGMKKEDELREHLTKLIGQTEHKIEHKKTKLDDAKKQLEELKAKE